MKLVSTLLTLLLCFNFSALSQKSIKNKKPKLGIQGGANIGALWGANAEDGDSGSPGIGFNGGVYTYFHLIGDVDFKPSINYGYNGVSFDSVRELKNFPATQDGFPLYIDGISEVSGEVDVHYIELPLEFILNFGQRFAMQLGSRIGYMFAGNVEGEIQPYIGSKLTQMDIEDLSDHLVLDKGSLDWRVGIGFHYKLSAKTKVAANMVVGFNEINTPTDNFTDQLKNVYATTYIAYNIFGNYY